MRPAIATVIGPGWEPGLVAHTRNSGLARVVGRCGDSAGLADVAARADAIFVGSEVPWLPEWDLDRFDLAARVIGVASDPPGAQLLEAAGIDDVIDSRTPPAGMLSFALASHPRDPGRVIEVTGPRGAPGRSEVALALAFASPHPALLIEADAAAPSLGLRMGLPLLGSGEVHQVGSVQLAPCSLTARPVHPGRVVAAITAARSVHGLTVVDGGPNSRWHQMVDVDAVVVVGEATDVGVVRLAHLCEGWMGPTPVLVINRHREDQDLRRVLRATGLEPAVVLPALDPPAQGQLPAGRMQSALKRLSVQRTAL